MRIAVLAILAGLTSASAGALDLQATGDISTDGVSYAPLEQPLAMHVVQTGGELRLSTTVTKLFDAGAYQALGNTWTTNIHVHVVLRRADTNDPIEVRRIVRSVHYDPWNERYIFDDAGAPHVVRTKADAFRMLTTLDDVPIARLADLPAGQLTIAVVAELNPISEQARAEVAGWVSGSVFGRLVSLFVEAGPDAADRVLRAQSAAFRL
jgi:hypothetical protein